MSTEVCVVGGELKAVSSLGRLIRRVHELGAMVGARECVFHWRGVEVYNKREAVLLFYLVIPSGARTGDGS